MTEVTTSSDAARTSNTPRRERLPTVVRTLSYVLRTSPRLVIGIGGSIIVVALAPAFITVQAREIIDGVVAVSQASEGASERAVYLTVAIVALLTAGVVVANRYLLYARAALSTRLSAESLLTIAEQTTRLSLPQLEDEQVQTALQLARRDGASRAFQLFSRTTIVAQSLLTVGAFLVVLLAFHPGAAALVLAAALPLFVVESSFGRDEFVTLRKATIESREQGYLEAILTRPSFATERIHYGLAPWLLSKFRERVEALERRAARLGLRRVFGAAFLSLLGMLVHIAVYGWIVHEAMNAVITVGAMTMYIAAFRQTQTGVNRLLSALAGIRTDSQFVRDFFAFLDLKSDTPSGSATEGVTPGRGLEFINVTFTYPGSERPAVSSVSFTLRPGNTLAIVGRNGSGKTTLIKLLLGMYQPDNGQILYDGTPLAEWSPEALRHRVSVLLQGYNRYKLAFGTNIGLGDGRDVDNPLRWERAAALGLADDIAATLSQGFAQLLGKSLPGALDLSGGQWQRVALSRAYYNEQAELLVLDEPSAALDAQAEAELFHRVLETRVHPMTVLISHRLANVRRADHILVLEEGRVMEEGTHDALLARGGHYAALYELQASAYSD